MTNNGKQWVVSNGQSGQGWLTTANSGLSQFIMLIVVGGWYSPMIAMMTIVQLQNENLWKCQLQKRSQQTATPYCVCSGLLQVH